MSTGVASRGRTRETREPETSERAASQKFRGVCKEWIVPLHLRGVRTELRRRSRVSLPVEVSANFFTSEFRPFFNFTRRDWSATLIPGLIVATWAVQRASLPAWNIVRFIPWTACYLYFFNLSNQIVGIDEDRINKPGRPLPSGQITVQGAMRRCAIALAAFLWTALLNGQLIAQTLTWVATTAFLCLTPYGGHWFGKNVVAMSVGAWVLLSGVYNTIAETTPLEERFFVVVAIWVGSVSLIQDLRDIDGDKVVGRKTLPIVAGIERSRLLISYVFLPLGYAVLCAGGIISAAPMSLTAAHALLAYRVLSGTDARHDHKTYMVGCPCSATSSLFQYGAICDGYHLPGLSPGVATCEW